MICDIVLSMVKSFHDLEDISKETSILTAVRTMLTVDS